ncbi:MAG: translocation/assembly module TamB domain-containing protein, partial [Bacteroidales bacterium]|nr:translocation/assembly module TamB domain-containing protein [Bacteroidales bacterium]
FNLRYIAPIVRRIGMEVAGEIDGRMRVRDPGNSFDLSADVRLNDLRLNDGYYGKGLLTAVFNRENRQIDGRLTIGPDTVARPYLALDGYVDLKRKTLDFKGRLHHLPSQFLSGYFRSFATDLTGGLDGSLRLYGPLKRMKWDLQAESEDLALTLSLLNTRYQFIRMGLSMSEEAITFTDGRLRDVRYDTRGRLSGSVHHRYLKDIELDLKLDFDQFLVLNTVPVKDMIYSGRVFATGRVVLSGLTNNLYIGVTARTDEDSHIDFDFSSPGGASASNFIRFEAERPVEINPLKAFYARRQQKEKGKGRLTVDLGLAINPQLAVGLDIHNVTVNGTLNAVGTGNMRLLVEPRGTQLFGTYSILSGVFDFSKMA